MNNFALFHVEMKLAFWMSEPDMRMHNNDSIVHFDLFAFSFGCNWCNIVCAFLSKLWNWSWNIFQRQIAERAIAKTITQWLWSRIKLHCSWEKNCIYGLIIQLLKKRNLQVGSSDQTGSFEVCWIELKQNLINIYSQNRICVIKTLFTQTHYISFELQFISYNLRKRNFTSLLKWMPCTRISFYPCRKVIHFWRTYRIFWSLQFSSCASH